VTDWTRLSSEALRSWRELVAALRDDERGETINCDCAVPGVGNAVK
jgi:rifampin ADP-ribosylating transferase